MTGIFPVIDLSGLAENNPEALSQIASQIGAACRSVGFFYVVNHGVSRDLMEKAFASSARFFASPLQDKQSMAIERVGGNRGYSGLLHEALDPKRGADRKEAFNIGLELSPDDAELLAGVPFRGLNVWPQISGFRDLFLEYFDACTALGLRLHRAFATDLGLEPDYFHPLLNRPMATLRLLHYPAGAQGDIGAGEHTDYGNITLLATDSVGGLEVKTRDGRWVQAPVMRDAFIVNIGDCLMRWTNDIYVSTPHRVVNRAGLERYSIAFFFDANPEAEVAALETCVAAGEMPHYPPVSAADYLRVRLDASKPAGIT